MKKIIIHNKQLKNIVNDDWQKNIIELATYKTLLKESINYEKKLIQDIQFLTVLKDELNINSMLNIELLNIYDEIIKKCWKVTYFGYGGIGYERYFDRKLKWKIINNYNKDIKFSNQKQK
ncbi:hypothetical protein [Spiroplasma endosymbiont of Polydrusus pterygomalis]|uniref:hypothetical protein n=1 Tax=Spiroplasma endosymbiont of Polydrusus pterygomalis TaxID=3139327 RepID=UPI003CCB2ADF